MLVVVLALCAVPLWEQPEFLAAVAAAPDPVGFDLQPPPSRIGDKGAWGAVDSIIQNFTFLPDMSFSVGTASGRKHTFEKGKHSMSKRTVLASSSKFPVALAIAGVVADGTLSFDTPIREVFDWWTQDPSDMHFGVTLRHLLTFTSGLVSKADPGGAGARCLIFGLAYSLEDCAREIYHHGPWIHPPGRVWSYHSLHLQLAGAMASKATGLPIKDVLDKYLLHKLGMTKTFWVGEPNPHLAAAMVSTGDDYDALLRGVLSYSIANKAVIDEMEKDVFAYYPGVRPAADAKDIGVLTYGHYSMCWFYECVNQPWSKRCREADIHSDPGAFGYWPLVNRKAGYYYQLVVQRLVVLPASAREKYHVSAFIEAALSAQCTSPLRFDVQPVVEKALDVAGGPVAHPFMPPPFAALCKIAAEPR